MDVEEDCCKCQSLRRQLEELKQKHLLDFRTIKQKIVSTDELIKLYRKKCQEFDKQTKCVAELTMKLEGCQRNMDVIRLQLEKSLEMNGPMKKACQDLEKEKSLRRTEIQKLQDRLRGSENLVSQMKNVVNEKEKSEEALRLDVSLQTQQIDEQKKSLKKNETQIKKLKEQILSEKNGKKEINKQLTIAQNHLKKMKKQLEESQEAVTKLTEELKQANQAKAEFNKVKLLSPSPPKRSRRRRRTIELDEQKDEEDNSSEILINEICNILALSPCRTISPLPPSPCSSGKEEELDSDDDDEFGNDDLDCGNDANGNKSNHDIGYEQTDDNISGGDDGFSESPASKSVDLSVKEGISNIAKISGTGSSSESKTSLGQPTTAEETLGKADFVAEEQSLFLSNSNSNRKRKRERLSSELEPGVREQEPNVNGRELCSLVAENELKTEETSDQSYFQTQETNLKKSRTELGSNHKNHVLNFIVKDDSDTDSTHPRSLFSGDTISATVESFEATWREAAEDIEQEVSACLRNIVEDVANQKSPGTNRGETETHTVSLDNKTMVQTESSDDLLETTQRKVTCEEKEVFDCLKNVIETIVNPESSTNPSASSRDNALPENSQDVKGNEQTIVPKSSRVCSEFTGENDLAKSAVSFSLETEGQDHKTLDTAKDETVQSSLILDQPDIKFDESCAESKTVGCGGRVNEERSNKQSSNTRLSPGESCGRINEHSRTNCLEEASDKPRDDLIESNGDGLLAFLLDFSTPLSPIPDSPERSFHNTEIPSFESWETLPSISPLPPSPKRLLSTSDPENAEDREMKPDKLNGKESTDMVSLVHAGNVTDICERTANSLSEADVDNQTFVSPENIGKTGEVVPTGRKKTKRKKTALGNSLDRSSKVKEPAYVLRLLSKLKKQEITTQEAILRFSVITNLRASSPFVSALIEMLKVTAEDVEDGLIEKFAEQYKSVSGEACYREWQPVITEFEMRVTIVVWNLIKLTHFSGLLLCSLNLLGKTLFGLFRTENNDSAVLAMCRMYTTLSRLMGDGGRVRVFCYDIVKENRRHLFTTKIILSVSLVWPEVLWQKDRFLFPRNSVVSGPPRQPFLSTLQTIIMSREISCELEQSVRVLRLLCGWSEIGNGKEALELQALDLVRVIQDSGYVTLEMKPDFGPSLGSGAFETVKSLELLAAVLGWEWTNDVLIRKLLWPVLREWKIKELCKTSGVEGLSEEFDLSKCTGVDKAEITKQMLNQKSEEVVCYPEVEAVDVENGSKLINIEQTNVHKDERTIDCPRGIEVWNGSEVAKTINDALNSIQKDKTICNHTDLKVEIGSKARNVCEETSNGELEDQQNTNTTKISGCLSDMEQSNISQNTIVNGNCNLPKTEERTVPQMSDVNRGTISSTVSKVAHIPTNKDVILLHDCGPGNKTNTMEATIVSIMRLLGLLGLVGLQQEEEVNLDAIINLTCAVLTYADEFEGVTFGIQLGAAYAAMDLFKADPSKILKVLNNWTVRIEEKTRDVNLPPHFTQHFKYLRTHLSAKPS